MNWSSLHIVLAFIALVCIQSFRLFEAAGQTRRMTPQVILKKTAASYASLSSYQDVGIVITTYDQEAAGRIEKLPFKLFFSRPNWFRCEWLDYYLNKNGRLSVVWTNSAGTFTYREPDRYERRASVEMGIAAVTGVSAGAAYDVPRLLMPDIDGWAVTDLKKTALVGEEVFEGELCYRIKGFDWDGDLNEVWINQRDFLIRKITTHSTFGNFSTTEEQIHRNIKVNQPIAKAVFDFKPPIALHSPTEAKEGEVLYAPERPTWSEFSSSEGRFKVLMPGPPVSQTLTLETRVGRIVHHSHVAQKGGVTCIIDFADMPEQFSEPDRADMLFDEARDQFLKDTQGRLLRERSIALDDYHGREVKVHMYRGEALARFYLVGDRFYQLAITTLDLTANSESEITSFFSSFKVTAPPKPVANRSPGCTPNSLPIDAYTNPIAARSSFFWYL